MAIIDHIQASVWFADGDSGSFHKNFRFISENASLSTILQSVLPHDFFQLWKSGMIDMGIRQYGTRAIKYDDNLSFYEVCKSCIERDDDVLKATLHIIPIWN